MSPCFADLITDLTRALHDEQQRCSHPYSPRSATPKGSSSSATTATTARPLPPSLAAPLSRSAPFASSSSSRSRTGQAPQNGISLAQDLGRTVLADHGAVTVSSLHPGNGNGNGKGKEKETGMSTAEGQVGDKWGMAPLPRLSKKQIRAVSPDFPPDPILVLLFFSSPFLDVIRSSGPPPHLLRTRGDRFSSRSK